MVADEAPMNRGTTNRPPFVVPRFIGASSLNVPRRPVGLAVEHSRCPSLSEGDDHDNACGGRRRRAYRIGTLEAVAGDAAAARRRPDVGRAAVRLGARPGLRHARRIPGGALPRPPSGRPGARHVPDVPAVPSLSPAGHGPVRGAGVGSRLGWGPARTRCDPDGDALTAAGRGGAADPGDAVGAVGRVDVLLAAARGGALRGGCRTAPGRGLLPALSADWGTERGGWPQLSLAP